MHFIYLANGDGVFDNILNIISLLLIFALVVFLAYVTAKFVAKYQDRVFNSKSNIKIIESFRLGNNKFIAIVKIAESYYAIGIGKDEITMLDKINPEELKIVDDDSSSKKIDFKEILSQIKDKELKDKNVK
jgi:flagellar protein FliO/FliZ